MPFPSSEDLPKPGIEPWSPAVHAKSLFSESDSEVAQSCLTLFDPMDSNLPGSTVQEYWSELPFSSPGDLPNPGIEPGSPALQTDALPSEPLGKPSEPLGKPESPKIGKSNFIYDKSAISSKASLTPKNSLTGLPQVTLLYFSNFIFSFILSQTVILIDPYILNRSTVQKNIINTVAFDHRLTETTDPKRVYNIVIIDSCFIVKTLPSGV